MNLLVVTSIALLTGAISNAHASGFYVGDIGTRGMARGGAFVAAPDSVLAIHYNPAGLSLLRGLHASASMSLVELDLSFLRSCPCVDPSRADAAALDRDLSASFQRSETGTPLGIPFLGVAYGFPFWDLTVALAAYAPNSGRHDWGQLPSTASPAFELMARTVPERYSALAVKNMELNFALGAALQVLDGLRIGGSLIVYQVGGRQSVHLWANSKTFASSPEDPRFDVPLDFDFKGGLALNWNVGASWAVTDRLSLGASFRAKRSIHADGTVDVSLPQLLIDAGAKVTGREVEVELDNAPIGRIGAQYVLPDLFTFEAAVIAEWWSVHENVLIRPKEVSFTLGAKSQPLGVIDLVRNWRDTYSVRLGGEIHVFEPLFGLSLGYFFEPSAINMKRIDPSRVDLDKHGIGLGASTRFYGATLQISVAYVALERASIRDSAVGLKAPLAAPLGSDELVTTVGNGDYEGNYLIGSAGLAFALDE
jgi:long-chain fatty acid transport protein